MPPHGDQRTVTFPILFRRVAYGCLAAAAATLPTGVAAQAPAAQAPTVVAAVPPTAQELARVSLSGKYLAARHAGQQRDIGVAAA